MCYIFKYLCCCLCCKSGDKKNGSTFKTFGELPSKASVPKERPTSIAVDLASSPSRLLTTDLTRVYEIPNKDFRTEDEVISSNGFQIDRTDLLGKGVFGEVFTAVSVADKTLVAVKIMSLNSTKHAHLRRDAKNELFVLEKTSHPYIMQFFTHFIITDMRTDTTNVFIFMRFAENKSLSDYVRHNKTPMNEDTAKRMFAQMVSAVDHMHSLGIAHRDLKMGNILLDSDLNVMVSDFGLSRVALRKSRKGLLQCNKKIGTPPYMSPEILVTEKRNHSYDPFVADIWALGVILFSMVNRCYPFGDEPEKMIKKMIRFEQLTGSLNRYGGFSADFDDIVRRMLCFDKDNRIKLPELIGHNWIREEINMINIRIDEKNLTKHTLTDIQNSDIQII